MLNNVRQKYTPHTKQFNRGQYKLDLTTGPIIKKIFLFSLPLAAMIFLQFLFNSADLAVIGHFAGEISFSAVGATGTVTQLLVNLFMGLSVGTNIVVGKFIGEKNFEKVNKAVHTSILSSIIFGIFAGVLGLLFCRPLLILMNCKEDFLELANKYLSIYFIGTPFCLLYNYGAAVLRAIGDTKRPLYFLTICGVLNIILNIIFVVFFKMDVSGVALATVITQGLSAIMITICLTKLDGECKLSFKKLKIDGKILLKIMLIGFPAGIQSICFNITNVIAQSYIISLGTTIVGAYAAEASLSAFISTVTSALYNAAVAFCAQNYGAKKIKYIGKLYIYLQIICFIFTAIVSVIFIIFNKYLLMIYTDNSDILSVASEMFIIIASFYVVWGISEISIGFVRGMGHSIIPMIISIIGICGLRIAYFIFIFPINPSYLLLIWVYPISWIFIAVAHTIYYMIIYRKTKIAISEKE